MKRSVFAIAIAAAALLGGAQSAWGIEIDLDRPGQREFVRDLANMIDPADEDAIRALADKLLTEKATPILVVTIPSMQQHLKGGGDGMRIETFARLLFDQWGIGQSEIAGHPWNTGILLLVSRGDRKARIELGGGWRHDKDAVCQKIMDEQIIPRFKTGDFTGGIVAGVRSLDAMARDLKMPDKPIDWRMMLLWAAVAGLAAFTGVSLYRRGSSGWAWVFWGITFATIGTVLYTIATSRGSGGSSGGFGGGSFGGGSSGGGGASGSW